MKMIFCALALVCVLAGAAYAQGFVSGATDMTGLQKTIDSTAVYRLGSTGDYGGSTSSLAAATNVVHYNHVCAANEYAICHQYRIGGGIIGFDYVLTLFAVVINAAGTDSSMVINVLSATAAETRLYCIDAVYGGQVIIAGPGETLRLRAYNGDNELDGVWKSWIVERRKFE